MDIQEINSFRRLAAEMDGVLGLSDLKVLIKRKSVASFYRAIEELITARELAKIKRGIYALPTADLSKVVNRVAPAAYISTETVLAKAGIIGTVPKQRLQAVWTSPPRTYDFSFGRIELLSIAPKLYFGFQKIGLQLWATPEKAFLDSCYYYYKRKRFSFNRYGVKQIHIFRFHNTGVYDAFG